MPKMKDVFIPQQSWITLGSVTPGHEEEFEQEIRSGVKGKLEFKRKPDGNGNIEILVKCGDGATMGQLITYCEKNGITGDDDGPPPEKPKGPLN